MTLLIFPDPLKRRAKAAHAKKSKMVRPQQSTQSLPAPQQYYPQGVPPSGASTLTLPAQLHISVPTPPPPGQMPWTSNSPPIMPPRPANPGWAGAAMYQHHPDQSGMFAPPMAAASTPYLPSFPSSSSSPPLGSISPPQPTPPQLSNVAMAPWASNANLASTSMANLSGPFASASTQLLNQSAALFDVISSKFDDVITGIDGDSFSGEEHDLFVDDESSIAPAPTQERSLRPNTTSKTKNLPPNRTLPGSNYFSKTWLYANSRLPPHLPPLKVYMPTWPLLCLAAQYSERAYGRPEKAAEAATHVDADWKRGTKAMVLKSVPVDDMNTVVFAIRGSQTFMDWAVNFRPAPSSPVGFLDDPGNLCHTGFLNVARSMVAPVSARLRTLLSENPARSNCSLLITGHSAGGAVAALLYAHMMSTTVESELNHLTGFFKRVHCVTFGAPPVSLLPLTRNLDKAHRKSVFFSFVNEGDPVCRADRETVRSLLKLYVSAPPPMKGGGKRWDVPTSVLSLAGRVVVLRVRGAVWGKGKKAGPGKGPIEAVVVDDEMLRRVVYGDPMMHMMNVYSKRLEELATRAVTAQDY